MKFNFANLVQAREAYRTKSDSLARIFRDSATTVDGQPSYDFMKVSGLDGETMADRVDTVRQMNRELDDLRDEVEAWLDIENAKSAANGGQKDNYDPERLFAQPSGMSRKEMPKSIGELFVNSPQYSQFKNARNWPQPAHIDMDVKDALFYTGGGWAPEVIRIPRLVEMAMAPVDVISHIPQGNTDMTSVNYMEETTFTNTAAETAEATVVAAADLIPEAALALTERTVPVQWIPVFIPVTQQQIEDVAGIQQYLNQRLSLMVRQRLNSQILQGTGAPPNLMGTEGLATHQIHAKGADPVPDAISKAFTMIRTTGWAEPSVLFAHPNDWQDVRLLRTVDGIYIFGSPTDPGPTRMWGVPVVETTACVENTMITGDYQNYSMLYTKRGIEVDVSDSHAFYFTRGTLAVRASMRVAMVHFRPTAFCTITGV